MFKANRVWLILLIVVLSMGLLAACGGGDDEPAAEAPAAEAPAAEEPAVDADAALLGDADAGKAIFDVTCLACHGPGGIGVVNLGKDMTASAFIHEQSNQELIDFIKVGRDTAHPDNTTGVAMPPKGGNPALSDEDLHDVIAYIRQINVVE